LQTVTKGDVGLELHYEDIQIVMTNAKTCLPKSAFIFDKIANMITALSLYNSGEIDDQKFYDLCKIDISRPMSMDPWDIEASFKLLAHLGKNEKNLIKTVGQKYLGFDEEDPEYDNDMVRLEFLMGRNIDFGKLEMLKLESLDEHLAKSLADFEKNAHYYFTDADNLIWYNDFFLQALFAAHNFKKYRYKKKHDNNYISCEYGHDDCSHTQKTRTIRLCDCFGDFCPHVAAGPIVVLNP
jgi:hypothetical protein